MRESFPKSKISLANLDFHQFFNNKRLLHPKSHLKGNCYMRFEENQYSYFFETTIAKDKISLPNLDFRQFSCSKQLIYSKKHGKSVYVSSLNKSLESFLRCLLLFSFSLRFTTLPVFRVLPKPENIICNLL